MYILGVCFLGEWVIGEGLYDKYDTCGDVEQRKQILSKGSAFATSSSHYSSGISICIMSSCQRCFATTHLHHVSVTRLFPLSSVLRSYLESIGTADERSGF